MRATRLLRVFAPLVTFAALLLGLAAVAPSAAYPGAPWFEPSKPYDDNFPDPSVLVVGDTYYAYSTPTGGAYLPAMSSTDLSTWTARPAYDPGPPENEDPFFNDALPRPASWGVDRPGATGRLTKELWAPGVAKIGGHYVAYYGIRVSNSQDRFCISVATATSPLGPFTDSTSGPLQCDADPNGSIDPAPFVDTDGTPYLVWKSEGVPGSMPTRFWIRQLRHDGRAFAPGSAAVELLRTSQAWEGNVIESPSLVRYQGRLFLFYSANEWDSPHYATGYAECETLAGPCHKPSANPILTSRDNRLAPGGPSAFVDLAGNLRLAYHWWNAPYTSYPAYPQCESAGTCESQGQRRMRVDQVHLDSKGVTVGGVPTPGRSLDPACPPGQVPPSGFTDVGGGVHAPAIDCVVWWKVASGKTTTTYEPDASVTREQMATFIANAITRSGGSLKASPPDAFSDDNGSVHETNINRLADAGVVSGIGGGHYGPKRLVTRAQMATFLLNAARELGLTLSSGTDYFWDDTATVHHASINAAAGAGLTGGRRVGVYAPDEPVLREQMGSFIARLLSLFVTDAGAAPPA